MSVFHEFGIERVSPSEIKVFAEDRGLWIAKYRHKLREDAGPAAWRGDAIESGLHTLLLGRDMETALAAAKSAFDVRELEYAKKHDGELHPDSAEAWMVVAPCVERAWNACVKEAVPKLLGAQGLVEANLPGAGVPVRGKYDFMFDAPPHTMDLKTTKSIPSVPKDGSGAKPETDHAIQASLYATARGDKLARILYVSTAVNPKDTYRLITLDADQIEFYARHAGEMLRQMEIVLTAALAMSEYQACTPESALAQLCRPNFMAQGGGFYPVWKSDFTRQALEAIPAWKTETPHAL